MDTSPVVCRYLAQRFPDYKVIQGDAFGINFDRYRDVVLVGIPYELNPWLLAKKGTDLFWHCHVAVFQSGCTAFFQHEHDWVRGSEKKIGWPWWEPDQTAPHHFSQVVELGLDWQTCVVAGDDKQGMRRIRGRMKERGFSKIKYRHVSMP